MTVSVSPALTPKLPYKLVALATDIVVEFAGIRVPFVSNQVVMTVWTTTSMLELHQVLMATCPP